MSLFDLQDVCIAIGSLATLDLPMVVDLIGIYGLKGLYCTLTTTDWFLQALSVIPRGSWGDVARRFTMIRWAGGSGYPTVIGSRKSSVCGGAPTRAREARDLRAGRAREGSAGTAARTCTPDAQPDLTHLLHEFVGRCVRLCGWTLGDDGRAGRALMALLLRAVANVTRRCLLRNGRNVAPLLPRRCAMAGRSRLRCWSTHAAHWLRTMRAARATLCVCRHDFLCGGAAAPASFRRCRDGWSEFF
ncbi:hypothetical protein F511_42065 [Dorcoceras hygrometricum]|uniref:Acyl-CoA dehydrogenase-related protein n=1 Tax=Dorcoceras hygrometricum TaxID=472368 RepID=A0A2Z7C8B9_9LAMI|nr:hypothetical protein F511_42065 [Dorcoceras hygrometricum]